MKNMAADVAGETVFILNYYDNIDEDKANKVLDDLIVLLTEKIDNVSVGFKNCYKELLKEFNEGIQAVVKEMNSLLSKEQLAENKKMANEA